MTKAEQFECNRLIEAMACHPESSQIAKMGQGFHAYIEKRYGREYALTVTDEMMDAVTRIRIQSQKKPIIEATGEEIQ